MIRLCFVPLFIIIGGNEVLCRNIRNEPIQDRFMSDMEPMGPGAPPLPPILAHIIQHGSNLFYKPQITFPALAIEAPKESINRDCEENKETSDNFVIEPADPQLNEPIKEIAIQQDTENIAQYVPEPPRLPVQFTEAEKFSGPLIIPSARPIKLPERLPAIFFEESAPILETEPKRTPIEIPPAPTLSPFEIPKFPIFVPIREEREQEKIKEVCITPTFYPAMIEILK